MCSDDNKSSLHPFARSSRFQQSELHCRCQRFLEGEEEQGEMVVSAAGRTSFAESTHKKEHVQAVKEAQATACNWKPEVQYQSCKIREGDAWCQGTVTQLPGGRQLESRPLQLGRVTTHLPEN